MQDSDENLLHAGIGQATITPPVGFPIARPDVPDQQSRGVIAELTARCMLLRYYGEFAAIVCIDVRGINRSIQQRIQAAVAQTLDMPSESVFLLCSGNSTSPPLWREDADIPSVYSTYIAYLSEAIAGAALEAFFALQPAAMDGNTVPLPNLNCFAEGLQEEELESEREALVVASVHNEDYRLTGLLYNFACPAAVIESEPRWSADYPGVTAGELERVNFGPALFVQGASADVRPFDWWDGNPSISHPNKAFQDAQSLGLLSASQTIRATMNMPMRRKTPIHCLWSSDGNIAVMRVGAVLIVNSFTLQRVEFAFQVRRALSQSTVVVSTNSLGLTAIPTAEEESAAVETAIELGKQALSAV